jgi:uncharacterized protein YndB with AHSA1/START domain
VTTHAPATSAVATAEMLIRRPVADVFQAFVDPSITTKFWFSRSSGPLTAGAHVTWEWEMYDLSIPVIVKALEPDTRILIEWSGGGSTTTVEWRFVPRPEGTFVSVTNAGFTGSADEILGQVRNSTEGFTLVLAGLKALLEHDIRLNLVRDRHPDGLQHDKETSAK